MVRYQLWQFRILGPSSYSLLDVRLKFDSNRTSRTPSSWVTYLVLDPQIQRRCSVIYRRVPVIPKCRNEYPSVEFAVRAASRTFFRLLLAAASITFLPVTVDPVNATLSTSMWAANAAPPTAPREGTVLITPGGNLISVRNLHRFCF